MRRSDFRTLFIGVALAALVIGPKSGALFSQTPTSAAPSEEAGETPAATPPTAEARRMAHHGFHAGSGDVAGVWEGAASTPDGLLGMSIELVEAEDGWEGTFAIPAERVEVPMANVRVEGDSLILVIAESREFNGRFDGDSIGGVLDIQGRRMPVTFARSGSPAAERLAERLESTSAGARAAPLERVSEGDGRASVDREALDRLVAAASAAHTHSLVVLRDGATVGAWHSGGEKRRIEAMSVTKSVLNLAVGRLVTRGAIDSLDESVHTFYPEWRHGPKSEITIRHLLSHTSGLHSPQPTTPIYASEDFVRFALDADLESEPGSSFAYNNNAANLLAGLAGEAAGERMDLFLGSDLFARMGITDFGWSLDEAGNPHGMSGLQIHAEDLAKLGQLVLQRGEWEGEQLIDPSWFDESLRQGSALSEEVGLLWWLIRENDRVVGYRADGYLGQYLVIYPDEGLVAVRLVESSPAYDPETDGLREFEELVRELAARSSRSSSGPSL